MHPPLDTAPAAGPDYLALSSREVAPVVSLHTPPDGQLPPRTIRVVIADDHAVVRDGLRALIEAQPGLTVVGEAPSGDEALHRIRETSPDVLLLDLSMPGMAVADVVETTRREGNVAIAAHAMTMPRLRAESMLDTVPDGPEAAGLHLPRAFAALETVERSESSLVLGEGTVGGSACSTHSFCGHVSARRKDTPISHALVKSQ